MIYRTTIALAVAVALAGPATAQVGDADECVKIHQTACEKIDSQESFMGLYVQNTCGKDISVFWRIDYHNASHPQFPKMYRDNMGVPWGYQSSLRHFQPRKVPPETINHYRQIPCWKKVRRTHCAEYGPDAYSKLGTKAYLEKLSESACYREIVKDPLVTRNGIRFHELTDFHPMVGGTLFTASGKEDRPHHISRLPR